MDDFLIPHLREERGGGYYYADVAGQQIPVISFCHPQVTVLGKSRGHENLFKRLYQDMLIVRQLFLQSYKERIVFENVPFLYPDKSRYEMEAVLFQNIKAALYEKYG